MKYFAGILLCFAIGAAAHDIPADATAHAFIRPNGNRLQVVVRVPLAAIRDIPFPETAKGYLDIQALASRLPGAAKVQIADLMEIREGSRILPPPQIRATQISVESDRSFDTFEGALRHVLEPKPPNSADLVWNQVYFDCLLEYPIESDRSSFFIRPGFHRLAARVVAVLRFQAPDGDVRLLEFQGDPGLIALDPRWYEAAGRFVELGFRHILDGADHLLFLLCLVIPLRRAGALLGVVSAFTVAHSVTLLASASGLAPARLWFPPLVETLIAASIVYMAVENIVATGRGRRRWVAAFCFGLVHGFGFSFALRENLQLAGSHVLSSLLAFNIGVELGQIAVLLVLVPLLELLFRFVVAERIGTIILSAFVAHTGWHWMIERAETLARFRS